MPTCATRPAELERREAQVMDPYPDDQVGPNIGFRPLGYQTPRSEAQQAKDQFYVSMLRQQNGGGIAPSPQGPTLVPQPTLAPSSYGTPQYSVPYQQPVNPAVTYGQSVYPH
ncbi:hypothetical protein KOR42_40720 [Thalassoglobus neptunius]|uniref:Uncharacterized protein n=1 Tax=Thalassoglobus neptunius TaxID=1938619 RepID=A0A5C5WAV4_9PLAN|nr:hypothetical protein [Thalassoglobus neptunius]TWT47988.1 hypothetical protein KOR42_40720 [Thalassoglobus neptunius]